MEDYGLSYYGLTGYLRSITAHNFVPLIVSHTGEGMRSSRDNFQEQHSTIRFLAELSYPPLLSSTHSSLPLPLFFSHSLFYLSFG